MNHSAFFQSYRSMFVVRCCLQEITDKLSRNHNIHELTIIYKDNYVNMHTYSSMIEHIARLDNYYSGLGRGG